MLRFGIAAILLTTGLPAEDAGQNSLEHFIAGLSAPSHADRVLASQSIRNYALDPKNKVTAEELFEIYVASDSPEVQSRILPILKELVLTEQFGPGDGFIGIKMGPGRGIDRAVPEGRGPYFIQIGEVLVDGAGALAGLRPNDQILGLNDEDYSQADSLAKFQADVRNFHPGQTITLHILRENEALSLPVTLIRRVSGYIYDPLQEDRISVESAFVERWLAERKRQYRKALTARS